MFILERAMQTNVEEEIRRLSCHQGPSVDGLRIGHVNTMTLKPKITTIRCLMKLHCFDILAISESNLTSKDRDATIAAEHYNLERFDRSNNGKGRGGPGGGVLCYIHKGVNYDKSSVTKSEGANNTQLLAIHLTSPVDLDLVIIYNPPKSRCEKQLEMLLTSLLWRRDPSRHILIIGDVKVKYFKPKLKRCFSAIEDLKLKQLIDFYTRKEEDKRSCLDHIYVKKSSLRNILEHGVVHFTLSDHDVIYCTWFAPTLVKSERAKAYQAVLNHSSTKRDLDHQMSVGKKIKKENMKGKKTKAQKDPLEDPWVHEIKKKKEKLLQKQ